MDPNKVVVSAVVAAIGFVAVSSYYYIKNSYSYWQRRGIKGPSPIWPFGHFHKLLSSDKLFTQRKWGLEYGKIYGIFFGTSPQLVLNDPELVTQICIKDFDSFTDHFSDNFFNKYQLASIFFLKGDEWRRMRILMSPTFTSGKIKRMFRFLDACADDLTALFHEQILSGQKSAKVNVKDLYNLYTMNAITNCCYGLKLQRDSNVKNIKSAASRNYFVKVALDLFFVSKLRSFVIALFPKALLEYLRVRRTPASKMRPMIKLVEQIIEQRRKQPDKNFDDYLQLLIDAKATDQVDYDDELDRNEDHHAGLTKQSLLEDQIKMQKRVGMNKEAAKLNDFEITSGAMFLILVGVETTATLLTHASYILAFNQEQQERLYREVAQIARAKDSFDYEALTSCNYLDAVLAETLRIQPPIPFMNRVANKDYLLEKYNLKIEKGVVVQLAASSIMTNPNYFQDPLEFDPNRFMPGNKEKIVPGSYFPFGMGPRHCIGMRFSLTEAKLALAKLIMNFKFVAPAEAFYPAEAAISPFLNSTNKAFVRIIPRA